MPVEFTCGECGRAMVSLTDDAPPACGLCGACICVPGWFRDPEACRLLGVTHDGLDRVEREAPCAISPP